MAIECMLAEFCPSARFTWAILTNLTMQFLRETAALAGLSGERPLVRKVFDSLAFLTDLRERFDAYL